MRIASAVVVVLIGCKGDGKPAQPAAKLVAPTVEVPTVLAADGPTPPFLVIVDENGEARLGAAASWSALDAGNVKVAQPTPLESVDRFLREEIAQGQASVESIKRWNELFPTLRVVDTPQQHHDVPPPEEDKPDDGEEESGGTGTLVNLDERAMQRAEEERERQLEAMDPQLAREQAIEQARNAGLLAGRNIEVGTPTGLARTTANPDGTPSRVAEVAGWVVDEPLENLHAMVVVAPTAKVLRLLEIVRDTHYAIAVMHGGKVRPLRIQFGVDSSFQPYDWLEVRVSPGSLVVEAVPDQAIEVADVKGLAAALDEARVSRMLDPDAPVDVLVDPNLDAQRLVDVLVALDTAGVRGIGLGRMPSGEQLERRGRRMARVFIGQPNAQGDLDKREIRRTVKQHLPQIRRCYEEALRTSITLVGTVQTQFFITPNGDVASASAYGVASWVSDCVAGVIKTLQFPRPKSGGGVQVNYPFTFRP